MPIRVFLIDDHDAIREALQALIATTADLEVVGAEAFNSSVVELARLVQPEIIVLDPWLAGRAGSEGVSLVASLMKLPVQPRLLVLTDAINESQSTPILEAGATGYLLKGTTGPEILQAIRRLHQGESVFDPAITRVPL